MHPEKELRTKEEVIEERLIPLGEFYTCKIHLVPFYLVPKISIVDKEGRTSGD